MSDALAGRAAFTPRPEAARTAPTLPAAGRYAISLLLVAASTLLAFVVKNLIAAPNLSLIFVLPVVIAGVAFGWGPSLAAALLGVMAFDFFFTSPYFSLRIASPADIWAAGLLLAVAAITTTVAAQSRRRALEAALAAERAEALQKLAQVVIAARPQADVVAAAAETLHRIFAAPAVIFLREAGALRRAASSGALQITPQDETAAAAALSDGLHVRAETYPFDQSEFEYWPVSTASDVGCVIGVGFGRGGTERPERPERFIDVVSAYLTVALEATPRRASLH